MNEVTEYQAPNPSELMLNAPAMTQIMKLADIMAKGVATVPKHLQGQPSDCLAIIMQAHQWGMNPFIVAQKTHLINGVLGYESQLVNAVVQSSGAIRGGFKPEYRGEGDSMECRVGAVLANESDVTWGEWLAVKTIVTKNSPLWKTNPKQQMAYLQVKNWARLYCPSAIMGVYTNDELQEYPANTASVVNLPLYTIEQATEKMEGWAKSNISPSAVVARIKKEYDMPEYVEAFIFDNLSDNKPVDKYAEAFSMCADFDALDEKLSELTAAASALTKPKITAAYNAKIAELEAKLGV